VYQDQVLLILQQFAGYTLGSADIVRKAMGKKIASMMAEERVNFVSGAQAKGYDEQVAIEIFDLIEPFAGYAFNKAHSVSYAMISYWTAYFKNHYPVEYMAAVLNSRLDNPEKTLNSMNECLRLGIPILLPDVNRSEEYFCIDHEITGPSNSSPNSEGPNNDGPNNEEKEEDALVGPGLRIGLAAIKTVGEGAVHPIVEDRKNNGPYQSIDDFCRRSGASGLNRRTLESLAKAGAFDSLAPRGQVIGALDQIIATAQREAQTRNSGQSSMFGGNDEVSNSAGMSGIPLTAPDVSDQEKADWERELLGMALSHNPLSTLAEIEAGDAIRSLEHLDGEMSGQSINMLGYVSTVTERTTREGKRFLIVNLEVLGGFLEVMVWPDTLQRTAEVWQGGRLVLVTGRLRLRGDQMSLACDAALEYNPDNPPAIPPLPKAGEGGRNGGYKNGGYQNGNGHNGNGNGYKSKNDNRKPANANVPANPGINEKKAQMTTGNNNPAESRPTGPQKVVCLTLSETDDSGHDAHLLREAIGVLLEYPGRDRVNLDIRTLGKRVLMDLPVVSTGYCDSLHTRLEELLGPDTVAVQQELGLGVEPASSAPVNMPLEAAPEPAPVPAPEAGTETAVISQPAPALASASEAEASVTTLADVSERVGVEAVGDEPPF
ncbi:MAG: OB-fold nucleic acid binding domain-containing protein, partial [Dehalococcoidia bacterium]